MQRLDHLETEEDEFELELHVCDSLDKLGDKPLYKMILVDGGSGLADIEGKRYPFLSPCVFVLNEKENIRIERQTGKLDVCAMAFHPIIINSLFEFDFVRRTLKGSPSDSTIQDLYWLVMFMIRDDSWWGQMLLNPISHKKSRLLMDTIRKKLSDKNDLYWICRSRSYFIELLLLISRIYQDSGPSISIPLAQATEFVDDIVLYLYANYGRKITLNDITREFGINRTTANALFQEKTGESIITYLIRLRMNVAAILLRDTNIPIKDICDRVGYNNINNFSRAFKQKIGYPPAQYRDAFKVSFC